jgi:hypothetical protein
LWVAADGTDAKGELNENNNYKSVTFTVVAQPRPDQIIESITGPASVAQGADLNFSYVLKDANSANLHDSFGSIIFAVDRQPTASDNDYSIGAGTLPAGGSLTFNEVLHANLSVGQHTLWIKADGFGNVNEEDETNNLNSFTFTVTDPPPFTDLSIVSINGTTSLAKGTSFNLSYVIKNVGVQPSPASNVGLMMDHEADATHYFSAPTINALAVNGTQSFNTVIDTGALSVGIHTVWLAADVFGALGEVSESNNWASFTFQVTMPADATTIESAGSTNVVEVGNQFPLWGASGSPSVRFQGGIVTDGQFGTWKLIGGEKTASGYDLVWKNGSLDQYAVWLADNNGNMLSNPGGVVGGSDFGLQSRETTFQQDLNGDGTVGVKSTVIESNGVTTLMQRANQYALWDASNNGPTVMFGGAPVTAGQFGSGWTPIGGEKTASGYGVAWKNGGLDQYAVWLVDNNGNMLSLPGGVVGGSDFGLQTWETTFQQDLNGDGSVGPLTTTIESSGSTKLVEVANQFQLWDASDSGPSVKFQGGVVTDGQFGAWKLIGGEKTASGYDLVWKNGGLDQYAVWLADNNGNMLSLPDGVVGGSDFGLQTWETTFQQDLNGDGTTGVKTTTIEANGGTTLVQRANRYAMWDAGNNGPALMFGGAPVVEGQFGSWKPIGAETTANGYEVAWKNGSLDQYAVWLADNNGNMLSNPGGVVGGLDFGLQSFELSFQQDLNGDGTVGVKSTVIESDGVTALVHRANQYAMWDIGNNGPTLMFGGAPVTEGRFGGGWIPIGAEKTASGYEVAWKNGGLDQYAVWLADNNGNMLSNPGGVVGGSDPGLQSFEPSFQQDLNSDGTVGAASISGGSAVAVMVSQMASMVEDTASDSVGIILAACPAYETDLANPVT